MIVEERILAKHHGKTWYGGHIYRQIIDPGDKTDVKIVMRDELFLGMGEPEVITVTMEPGDQLNLERLPGERDSEYAMRLASKDPRWNAQAPQDLT